MTDFLTALGLLFFIEGALYALFPGHMQKMAAQVIVLPAATLRKIGLVCAVIGFAVMLVLRGH